MDPDTGQGTVKNPLGLHGYNCRHSHKPWDPRLRNPYVDENGNLKIDSEENRKRYELQQKQRAMERSLRAWKRKLIVKEQEIAGVAETDVKEILQRDYDRIKVADFGREQTKRSNAGAKRHKDSLNIDRNRNIIKERILNGEYNLSLSKQQYLKHVDGTKQYADYHKTRIEKGKTPQGKILLSEDEVQKFIRQYSGTGIPKTDRKGVASNVEFVSSENVIGQYYKNGKWIDTKRVAIHHGKKASHIVPVEELENG